MAYPDIPDVAHEFAARLRFGTTFELMQFLAQQQFTLTERMAEEHADMQMIQRALAGTVDRAPSAEYRGTVDPKTHRH